MADDVDPPSSPGEEDEHAVTSEPPASGVASTAGEDSGESLKHAHTEGQVYHAELGREGNAEGPKDGTGHDGAVQWWRDEG